MLSIFSSGSHKLVDAACKGDLKEVARLSAKPDVNKNFQDKDGNTALLAAARKGHLEVVNLLLQAGADVNLQDKYGYTALSRAAQDGHFDVVKMLVQAKADVNLRHVDGHAALSRAGMGGHLEVVKALLQAGADVNLQGEDGNMALLLTATNGHLEVAKVLLQAGADVHLQDKDGRSALISAAMCGNLEVVKVLVQAGANVNLQGAGERTALMQAACSGYTEVVKMLLRAGADVNLQDTYGHTALVRAAQGGCLEVVKVLLLTGANANLQDTVGLTALMWAAKNFRLEVVKVLLQWNADANLRCKDGKTVFDCATTTEIMTFLTKHKAGNAPPTTKVTPPGVSGSQHISNQKLIDTAGRNDAQEVTRLLKLPDVDKNFQDKKDKMTALMWAAKKGHQQVVKVLLQAEANVNLQDKFGFTALIYAAGEGHLQVVKVLIQAGADVDLQSNGCGTALMMAAEHDHLEVVKVLLQAGADVNLQRKNGYTALIYAAEKGHLEMVKVLLQAGADVNPRDKDGRTALMCAAQYGHVEVVKVLLQAGADVNLQNRDGRMPLMWAASIGHLEVVKVLVQAGADVNLRNKDGESVWEVATEEVKMWWAEHKGDTFPAVQGPPGSQLKSASALHSAAAKGHSVDGVSPGAAAVLSPSPSPVINLRQPPASGVPEAPAPATLVAPALVPDVALLTQVQQLLVQAAGVPARREWMQRRDALQTLKRTATTAKNTSEVLRLVKEIKACDAESAALSLSVEDYATLAHRHQQLVSLLEAKWEVAAIADDLEALESLSQLLDSLKAVDLPFLGISAVADTPTTPTAERLKPEPAAPQYLCGRIPIAVSQPLKTATARVLLRGNFSASVVNMAFNTTTVTEVQCVIKCAVRAAEGEHVLDSVSALRSEHGIYKLLQSGAGADATGCVQCYSAHPLYHYLVLEDHGQDLTHLLTQKLQNGHQVVCAIVEAVQYLHSLGVMHGDIKPQNILYCYNSLGQCEVKLCDLDCARKVGEECVAITLGTDSFHAPEVYHAVRRNATVKAAQEMDLFPLGLVLWQVLQRSSSPALSHTTESQLQGCYIDQAKLWEHLPVPARGQWSYQYLQSLTSLEPHKRTSASALLQKIQVLNASNAQHGWLQEQERNDYMQHSVVDKLDQANAKLDKVLEVLQTKFDALGQEVVGVAATLRKEMLLGRDHGQVLEGMVSATQEALEQLSRPTGDREAGSDQVAAILYSLQARIEHGVAAALAKQPSNRSSGPDPSAAVLSELSAQFQSRFTALSTDVRQLMDNQRRTQAVSASSEQEQQRQAQQMHQRLSSTLQEVLNGVSAVKAEVQQLRQGQEALGRQVTVVLTSNAELAAMVNTLISGTHTIPTLAIILPVVSTSWRSVLSPMRLVRNQFRLFFLCSHTHQIAPGGPKGKGYKINVTKQWVQDAAPVLRVGLVLVKLALLSAGLPLPIPDLPALLSASGLHAKYLDAALHLVQNPADDSGGSEFDMDKVIDKLASLGEQHLLQEQGLGKGKGGMALQEGSRKAYETIQEVLSKDGVNIALTSGLRQVTHKGKTAWVMDNDAVEAQFKASL